MSASTVPHLAGAKIGRIGLKTLAIDLTVNYRAAQMEENEKAAKRIADDLRVSSDACKILSMATPVDVAAAYRELLSLINKQANRRIENELVQIAERKRNIAHARELAQVLETMGVAA